MKWWQSGCARKVSSRVELRSIQGVGLGWVKSLDSLASLLALKGDRRLGGALAYLGRFACCKRECIASRKKRNLPPLPHKRTNRQKKQRMRTDLDSSLATCQTPRLCAPLDFLENESVSTSQHPSPPKNFRRPLLLSHFSCSPSCADHHSSSAGPAGRAEHSGFAQMDPRSHLDMRDVVECVPGFGSNPGSSRRRAEEEGSRPCGDFVVVAAAAAAAVEDPRSACWEETSIRCCR